jgi:hypothetical protein
MAGKGGYRENAGRKSKAEEQRIKDLTSPYIPDAIKTVVQILKTGEKDADRISAAKLLLAYYFGNPSQSIDATSNGETIKAFTWTINDSPTKDK